MVERGSSVKVDRRMRMAMRSKVSRVHRCAFCLTVHVLSLDVRFVRSSSGGGCGGIGVMMRVLPVSLLQRMCLAHVASILPERNVRLRSIAKEHFGLVMRKAWVDGTVERWGGDVGHGDGVVGLVGVVIDETIEQRPIPFGRRRHVVMTAQATLLLPMLDIFAERIGARGRMVG